MSANDPPGDETMRYPGYTHLLLIVDRSGSMENIAKDMNGGIKRLLKDQAATPGFFYVDAWTFDTDIDRVWTGLTAKMALKEKPLIVPRGGTALNDAIGKAVVTLGEELAALEERHRPERVMVVIVTDGYENASREWTAERVKALVAQQRDVYDWQFVFLGANIDAFATGSQYGFAQAQTMNYAPSAAGASNVFASTSSLLRSYRGGATGQSLGFSDEDRNEAMES